ncbi:ankyrin repeat-containing domain protein [Lactifluus volemus]|nr:ankyrin repeat-containing domain protein [Lactifluus volemus]
MDGWKAPSFGQARCQSRFPANNGWTPLHRASLSGHLEVVRLLLDHGADVNATKQDHRRSLHLASSSGYPEIVKLLLERGADIHVLDDDGRTPSQEASRRGYRRIVKLLSEYGCNTSSNRYCNHFSRLNIALTGSSPFRSIQYNRRISSTTSDCGDLLSLQLKHWHVSSRTLQYVVPFPLPIILFLRSIVELKPWDTTSSFSLTRSVQFPTVRNIRWLFLDQQSSTNPEKRWHWHSVKAQA